jgi:hypothetical protein
MDMSRMITQSTMTTGGVDLKTPPLPEPLRTTQRTGDQVHHITVACVWWGDLYGIDYVEKLRDGVARNLHIPHTFVCITDNKVPEGVIKMKPQIKAGTWWQKVGLFSPDLFGRSARILYLDLDLVVVGSLDQIANVAEPFCMIENYGPNTGHAAHNSSCMVWTPSEETDRIFNCFTADVSKQLHGDQCWIWRVMRDTIHDFPKHYCVSYKYEKQRADWRFATNETSCVVFHGEPKPHKVKDPQIVNHWRTGK